MFKTSLARFGIDKTTVEDTLKKVFIFCVIFYQYTIRFLFGQCCRFNPSCSNYSISAVWHHGVKKGILLTLKRIMRCHPWQPGGYDPVPKVLSKSLK